MAYGKIKADTLTWDNAGTDTDITISTIPTAADLAAKVNTADIGVTVQAYDANLPAGNTILVDGDVGSVVQAYDATILNDADIGVNVQGYDADNAVTDATQTFTAGQRGEITTLTSSSGVLAIDFDASNNFYIELSENLTSITASNATAGQSGSIFIAQPSSGGPYTVGGWAAAFLFSGGTAPTITATNSKTDRVDYVIRTSGEIQVVWTGNYWYVSY